MRLPQPTPDEIEHSARLMELIRAEVARAGALDFARFMELALYAPGLGYYSAGKAKFGSAGDFVTAPELGDVYARCLARTLAPILTATAGELLELGAGSGVLAADLLLALERLDALPRAYRVLETSADLRQRQAATLAARAPRLAALVHWLDAPPRMPWRGALLANEVVDALPVRLFEWRREVLVARAVTLGADDVLVWTTQPADAELRAAFEHVQSSLAEPLTGPYRSELRPALPAWLAEVGGALAEGLMLFVDYGYPRGEYYLPERRDGTLVCHYRHRAHADPLILVGLQDLTAFVDFTALAEAGHAGGFELAGYCTQSAFLLASGLPAILEQSARAAPEQQARLAQQVKRLTLPGEMGERFQVMAFTRKLDVDALPFAALDRSERL